MIQNFRFFNVVIFLMFVIAIASCKKSDTLSMSSPDNNQAGNSGVAFISVIHAAPQTGSLQFAFDKNRVNLDIFNFTDRVNYLNTFAGQRRFSVFRKGLLDTLVAKNMVFQQNKNYSIFIADVPGKTDAVLVRDSSRAPGPDSVRIRFANMSPEAVNLDFYIEGDSKPLARNISFKNAGEFLSLKAANNLTLLVRLSGREDVVSKINGVNLVSGNYYTVWSRGLGTAGSGGATGPGGSTGSGVPDLGIFWH